MERLFVDTSAWYAMELSNDQYSQAATGLRHSAGRRYRWTTTNWIIWETVSLLRKRAGHAIAVGYRERVQASRLVEVITISAEYEARAWDLFKRYQDKDFGFVDCTSFAVMEALKLSAAFTFDEHFRQAGFHALPDLRALLHESGAPYDGVPADPLGTQG